MGGARPKQFLELDGVPILARTLRVFESCKAVHAVVLVVPESEIPACKKEIVAGYGLSKVTAIVPGGERRQDSVRLGLEACANGCDIVLVHDGVRPLVREKLLERAVGGALEHGAVIAALPAKETIKEVDAQGLVTSTPDRNSLWLVQTPQAFRFRELLEAHEKAFQEQWEEVTDDSMLLERMGRDVRVLRGDEENIKVTTPHDLEIAGYYLHKRGET
jgi:2-C-methyl-D-erythritol 4-phosphate cytidylyltransferase